MEDEQPLEAAVMIERAASALRQLSVARPEEFTAQAAATLLEQAAILEACARAEECVEVSAEAVAFCEQLARLAPVRFEALHAAALSQLSRRLADRGQRDRALVAAHRATAILRRLHRLNPRGYLTPLADSLLTLSERLCEVGRIEEAAERAGECVQFLSLFEGQDPRASSRLAAARLTESVWLAALGSWQASLHSVGEAVGLLRVLSAQDASYSAGLAAALTNQAAVLGELGRYAESARTAAEAADVYRQTEGAEDALVVTGLGAALTDFVAATSDHRAAQSAAQEAGQLIDGFGDLFPFPGHGAAAAALLTLSRSTAAAGSDVSLELARRSLMVHGELSERGDEQRRPPWGRALSATLRLNLAEREADARQFDAALGTADRALRELRRLAVEQPSSAFRRSLAATLLAQSRALAGLGRSRDSVTALREAREIHRSLAAGGLNISLERLRALRLLAGQLGVSGAPGREIQAVLREAVALYATVQSAAPSREAFEVADMLREHAQRLFNGGDAGAVAAAREAVVFLRALPSPRSPELSARLASSYATLSWALHAARRAKEGAAAARSAVAVRRTLASGSAATPRSRELLARALRDLALSLEQAGGSVMEQLSAVHEAVTVYQALAADGHPVVHSLARALLDEAEALRAAGYRGAARTSAQQAVGYLRELAEAEPRRFTQELAGALDALSGLLALRDRAMARRLRREAADLRGAAE